VTSQHFQLNESDSTRGDNNNWRHCPRTIHQVFGTARVAVAVVLVFLGGGAAFVVRASSFPRTGGTVLILIIVSKRRWLFFFFPFQFRFRVLPHHPTSISSSVFLIPVSCSSSWASSISSSVSFSSEGNRNRRRFFSITVVFVLIPFGY